MSDNIDVEVQDQQPQQVDIYVDPSGAASAQAAAAEAAEILEQILDAVDPDASNTIVELTGFSISGTNFILNPDNIWRLSGTAHTNPAQITKPFELAAAGNHRRYLVLLNADNDFQFEFIEGAISNPAKPVAPDGTLELTDFTVNDTGVVTPPTQPILGSVYVKKENYQSMTLNSTGVIVNAMFNGLSHYEITSATEIRGLVSPSNADTFDGQFVSFTNMSENPVPFRHLHEQGYIKFFFPNLQDFVLQPKTTEAFRLNKSERRLYFVGRIGGTQSFQSVTENGATSNRELQLTKVGGFALDVQNSTIRANFLQTILDFHIGRNLVFSGGSESATAGFYKNASGTISSGIRISGKLEYNSFTGDTFSGRQIPHVNFIQSLIAATTGSTVSGTKVENIAARDAYNVPVVPFNVLVEDDGDGNWALYMAFTTGVGAVFEKTSDPDLLNAAMTAEGIKAAYESVANAFSNYYKDKLDGIAFEATKNRSDTETDLLLSGKTSIFYKSSAPFAPFSGAGVETIIGVIPINPNKLRNNTMALAKAMIRKNNAVSAIVTLTMYLNTAPNLSGATPLRSSHSTAGTMQSSSFETEFWIEDNLMKVPNATTINNVGISATAVSELAFNPANQYYIIITGNPGGNTSEIQCKLAQLTGTY